MSMPHECRCAICGNRMLHMSSAEPAEMLDALRDCVSALVVIDNARHEAENDAQRAAVAELRRLIAQGRAAIAQAGPR